MFNLCSRIRICVHICNRTQIRLKKKIHYHCKLCIPVSACKIGWKLIHICDVSSILRSLSHCFCFFVLFSLINMSKNRNKIVECKLY